MTTLTLTPTGTDSGMYSPVPKLKVVEDQFYRYDGEPYTLTIYYRSPEKYKIFHDRNRLHGSSIGVFNIKEIILNLK